MSDGRRHADSGLFLVIDDRWIGPVMEQQVNHLGVSRPSCDVQWGQPVSGYCVRIGLGVQ